MLLAAMLAAGLTHAQEIETPRGDIQLDTVSEAEGFGAGLVVGDPTGVSLGWRESEWNAFEVGLGYDMLDGDLKGSADYLRSVAVVDPGGAVRVPIYVGLGAGIGRDLGGNGGRTPVAILRGEEENDTDVSARVPIGASVLFDNAPIEIFGKAIPSLRVIPDRQVELDGQLGVRYYF
ncbi:MAG: hypothetical protein ACK4YP_14970 [Myxococcota bacterium]